MGADAAAMGESVGWSAALRSRWALVSISTLLYWCAAHALRSFVTLRLDALGSSDVLIGVAAAAFPALSLVLAIPLGRAMDRTSVRLVLVTSYVGMAVLGVGFALAGSPVALVVLQALNGVTELGVWLALQALASGAGRGAFLTRQLAVFSLAWGFGIAVGPVVGAAVFAALGFAALGWVYAALSGLALLVALAAPSAAVRADPDAPEPPSTSLFGGMRVITARPAVRAVLLASFVALYCNSIKSSFYPLYLERSGVSVARIGLLLSIIGVASLLVRIALPALLRRLRAASVLVAGMVIEIVTLSLTPLLGTFWLLAGAAALFGTGHGVNPPITVELMARSTDERERGLAMGVRVTANRLAQVVQPVVFGGLSSAIGLAAAFPASGVLLAVVTGWAARQSRDIAL